MTRKRIFSGIRPSGDLHIGNYIGALRQWVKLQDEYEVTAGIVDAHAITTPHDPQKLRSSTLETAMTYLAAGLDPAKTILMVQSRVHEHFELAWILGTMTPLGELERMAQFKEKAGLGFRPILYRDSKPISEAEQSANLREWHKERTQKRSGTMAGLLNYPVLMAADILLYQSEIVPVGEDQVQHIELARSLAERFNNRYGRVFTIPQPRINEQSARIMSLADPTKKMSKSDGNEKSCVFLTDPPDDIREKIKAAVTDSGKEIAYDPAAKPAISNLLVIFSEFSGESVAALEKRYAGKPYAEFKADLAEAVVRGLAPLQERFAEFQKDESAVRKILDDGSRRAAAIAQQTLAAVKEKIGFLL